MEAYVAPSIELIEINTAPYFLIPIESAYLRTKGTQIEPIALGEFNDEDGDLVTQSFKCSNCLIH